MSLSQNKEAIVSEPAQPQATPAPEASHQSSDAAPEPAPVRPKCPECSSVKIRVDSFDLTNVFCVWCTDCGHVYGVGYGPVEDGCPSVPVTVTSTEQPVEVQQPIQVRVM